MIETEIELSCKAYRPGQTFNAVITLSKTGLHSWTGRRVSRDHTPGLISPRSGRHSRVHSKDISNGTSESNLRHINTTGTAFPKSPTSPISSPTSLGYPNGHARTRSITFETVSVPSRTRRASRSGSIPDPDAKVFDTLPENLLIVYMQLLGTFSVDDGYIAEDAFEKLKGLGVNNATGGVVANSTVTGSRWSFGNWTNVLSGSQPSSIAELRQAAATKTLPVFSMPPVILEVGVSLKDGECIRKMVKMDLPECLPPSYSGTTMNIAYSLKLSAQRDDNSTTSFECPIQIYPCKKTQYNFLQPHILQNSLFGITPFVPATAGPRSVSTREDFAKFLDALKDPALNLPSPILERKHFLTITDNDPSYTRDLGLRFDVSRGEGEQVCKVTMPRSRLCPGDVITGTIDLRDNHLHCFQCTVTLESHESIDVEYTATSPEKISQESTKNLGRDRLMTTCAIASDFEVPVPNDVTPTFVTTPLALQYSLLFQFLLHDQSSLIVESRTKHGIESRPIEQVEGQSFECRVPLTIVAADSASSIPTSKRGEL